MIASDTAASLPDKLIGYSARALTVASMSQAVYGNDSGSFSSAVINSLAASASADAAQWVGAHSDVHSIENLAGHALVGCAGALASAGDCAAGALGAAAAASVNPVVDQFLSAEDIAIRNAQLAALATAISGLAASGFGLQVDTTVEAAQNETLNNYLTQAQKLRYAREAQAAASIAQRLAIAAKYGLIDKAQNDLFAAGFIAGVPGEFAIGIYDTVKLITNPAQFVDAMRALLASDDKLSLVTGAVRSDLTERLDRYQTMYESGGFKSSEAGFEAGRIFAVVATSLTGAVGAARASTTVATKLTTTVAKQVTR